MVPVVLAAVQDDRRHDRSEEPDVCQRVRRGSEGERLLRCQPRGLQPRDERSHRGRDPHRGDLGRVRIALDLGQVRGVRRLQVDDRIAGDGAERPPRTVLKGDEPHATRSGSSTPRPASASRSAGRSASGKSGKGRRTGPQSRPSIRSASFVGDTYPGSYSRKRFSGWSARCCASASSWSPSWTRSQRPHHGRGDDRSRGREDPARADAEGGIELAVDPRAEAPAARFRQPERLHELPEIVLRLLQPDDPVDLHQFRDQRGREAVAGVQRVVVDDDRQDVCSGDVLEEPVEHVVGDPEVERRHEDRRVRAGRRRVPGQLDRLPRRARGRAGEDRHLAGRLRDDDLGHEPPLVAGEVREFARPARRHDPVDAAVDDVAHDAPEGVDVHLASVRCERGRDRRYHPVWCCLHRLLLWSLEGHRSIAPRVR